MIDRGARVHLLREVLREEFVNTHGDVRFPSEPELCAQHNESRNVVRDALALLREEGLIERLQGRGTFAVTSRPAHSAVRMYFVGQDLDSCTAEFETLAAEPARAGTQVASRLDVPVGSPLVCIQRRTWLDGVPFSLQTSLLPMAMAGWMLEDPPIGEWYDALEAAGFRLDEADQVFEATMADVHVSRLLLVDVGAPLMLLERLLILDDGRPLELGFVRCRGDRLAVRVPAQRAVLTALVPVAPIPVMTPMFDQAEGIGV